MARGVFRAAVRLEQILSQVDLGAVSFMWSCENLDRLPLRAYLGAMKNRLLLAMLGLAMACLAIAAAPAAQSNVPRFELDPLFPQLPAGRMLGDVSSVTVDSQNHVWLIHRPRTLPENQRASAAPPVLEFDASGKFIAGWGGPSSGCCAKP